MKPRPDNDNRFVSDYERAIKDMTESEYNNYTLWGELDELFGQDPMEEAAPSPTGGWFGKLMRPGRKG